MLKETYLCPSADPATEAEADEVHDTGYDSADNSGPPITDTSKSDGYLASNMDNNDNDDDYQPEEPSRGQAASDKEFDVEMVEDTPPTMRQGKGKKVCIKNLRIDTYSDKLGS